MLPEGDLYPKADRAVRDVLRKRAHVVRQHTANGLSVHNILARHTGMRFSAKRMHECTKADLEGGNKPKIERALKNGQMITVQVTKNPIAHKGARLTQEVSLAGRFLVMVPNEPDTYGISKRLPDGERISFVESTLVQFAPLSDEEITRYLATGEPHDKAGAYAIQGYAARYIPRIEGCYFNVVGLPLARLQQALIELGWTEEYFSSAVV